jgi:hypothetical protein
MQSEEMMKIKREFEIAPTPEEMALVFVEWHSDWQAAFLDKVATEMEKWGPHARLMQCAYIRQDMIKRWPESFDAFELVNELSEYEVSS